MENLFINQTPIQFKEEQQFLDWQKLAINCPEMYEVAFHFATESFKNCMIIPVITSIYRGPNHALYNPDSVHAHWRGVDFRVHHYSQADEEYLLDFMNTNFIYDYDRPELKCMIIHGEDMNRHIHLQVHEKTLRRIFLHN